MTMNVNINRNMRLASMCAAWLKEKFGLKADIVDVKVEEQTPIDVVLNTIVVKFSFIQKDGTEGEGAAFFNAQLVRQEMEQREKVEALA